MLANQNALFTFDHKLLKLLENDKRFEEVLIILKPLTNPEQLVENSGRTLLHYAARYGNDNVVKYLIDTGADVDRQDYHGSTPIMLASKPTTADLLLDCNANIYIQDEMGKCAIHRFLHPNYNGKFFEKFNAEYPSDVEMELKLMDYDCSIYSSIKFRRPGLTRLLLKRGCNYAPPNSHLRQVDALILAVYLMDIENVRILLDFGVDVNAEGFRGETPMSCRAICYSNDKRRLQILRLLLERGADPKKVTSGGEMQMAPILKFGKKATIRVLLESNFDLNARCGNGRTPIYYVIFNESPGIYEEFKGKQYDVNVTDSRGSTPFHYISAMNFDAAKFLHTSGADINARDRNGLTVLMRVLQNNDYSREEVSYSIMSGMFSKGGIEQSIRVINYLLYHGADPQAIVPERQHSIFCDVKNMIEEHWLKSVLSHLVMMEARGVPIVEVVAKQINHDEYLRDFFRDCMLSLENMKALKIWGTLSVYQLLVDNEAMMERHVRNGKFRMFLYRSKNRNNMPEIAGTYWMYVLRSRLAKAINVGKLRDKASIDLSKALNLCQFVAQKITSYIGESDLRNLYVSLNNIIRM